MADTAVALFDWKADKPEAIDLKRGQVITLADRSGNWWRGTVDGKTGKFPSNYVALTKDAIKSVATHTYDKADDATHLKFKKGESIEIFKKDNTGWWVGRNAAGVVGTFPANHVQDGAKPKDEGSSRSSASRSGSRSPSSRSASSRSRSPSSRSASSRSRSPSSRSGSRTPSSRSRSDSASSRSASSRSRSDRSVSSRSASSAKDTKKAPAAKPAAEVKDAPKAAAAPVPPVPAVQARSPPVEEAKPAAKPAAVAEPAKPAAEAAKPAAAEPKKEEAKPAAAAPAKPAAVEAAKPAAVEAAKPAAPAAKAAAAPAPAAKAAAKADSGSESESASSRKSGSSKKSKSSQSDKSKSSSKSKSGSGKNKSGSSAVESKKAAAAPAKVAAAAPAEEKKAAAAAPAADAKKPEAKAAAPVEDKKPAPAKAAAAKDDKSASSRSRSHSRSPSESRSRTPSPMSSRTPSPKKGGEKRSSGKNKERIEARRDDASAASQSSRSRSHSEDASSFVEGFHPAIKIPDAQDKDDLRVLLMINESQDAVKVRHALEGIQDIIHLDKSGLIAKKSGAIPALSKKVQSLIAGGRPKVVKKDLDTCLDLLHQLVLDDFLAANDANDTGLTNPLVALLGSEAAPDTKLRARKVLIALTAEENLKTCDSIVHAGNLLTLANLFADGDDVARRDIGVVLARVLRVSGRLAQNALRQFHAFTGIVQALNSSDEHIQEAAAGVAFWAVKDSGVCKNRFRAAHGLLPLARLLSSESAKVALQASAATMELSAHNAENAKHFAKGTSAIPNLVIALRQHSLSHEGVVNDPLVHNVCGATWNIIRDRQYRVLAFLDEGIISPLIPLVERSSGPAHYLAVKLQAKASDVVQAHFYLSMEERWIKYQLAMQDFVRKHEAAVLADYRGEPLAPAVLEDQVKYDPYFTHHDHDPNVHRHAARVPAIQHFVAAGFNGPNVHVDPLVAGAPSGLRMHHTLAVPSANLPLNPPAYNGGIKAAGIFTSKKVFKGSATGAGASHAHSHKFDTPAAGRKVDVPVN